MGQQAAPQVAGPRLGPSLRHLRHALGVGPAGIALHANLSPERIRQIETHQQGTPSPETVTKYIIGLHGALAARAHQ